MHTEWGLRAHILGDAVLPLLLLPPLPYYDCTPACARHAQLLLLLTLMLLVLPPPPPLLPLLLVLLLLLVLVLLLRL